MTENLNSLIPTADHIRNTLLTVMDRRGIAANDPVARQAIIDVAIREGIGGAGKWIDACRGKQKWTRRLVAELIKEQLIFDLMSVLNRFEAGKLPFQRTSGGSSDGVHCDNALP